MSIVDNSSELAGIIISLLKADGNLFKVVKKWHAVNGVVPGTSIGISTGCSRVDFREYTNDLDEATAKMKIYAYTNDQNLERAEKTVQALAETIRFILVTNRTLGGKVDSSEVTYFDYVYSEEIKDLMAVEIGFEPIYFAPKTKERTAKVLSSLNLSASYSTD